MEETIKRIISIDQEADNYRRLRDEILLKKNQELDKEVSSAIEENKRHIEVIKRKIYEDEMDKAKNQISLVKAKEDVRLQAIMDSFNKTKNEIVASAFDKIIKTFEEL